MPFRTNDLPPDPIIEAYKKDIDVTLIRENLKLTPEERARKLVALQRAAEEYRRAGREARARRLKDAVTKLERILKEQE
jgi:hypothetical protein